MRRIRFYGLPHPQVRAVFRYLSAVVAAGGGEMAGDLVTGAEVSVSPDVSAIHIRPEAIDALDLIALADPAVGRGRPAGLTLASRLDQAWRDLPRLSVEAVLACERHAVDFLARHAGLPLDQATLAAARAGHALLAADPLALANPLGFMRMLEVPPLGESDEPPLPVVERLGAYGFTWRDGAAQAGAGEPPSMLLDAIRAGSARTVLLLAPDPAAALRDIAPHLPSWVTLAVPEWEAPEREPPRGCFRARWDDAWPELAGAGIDLIHLHRIDGWDRLDRLLPWARAQLPRHGIVTGMEGSAEALAAVVDRLAGEGRGDGIAFALRERQWRAVPHAWWSA